MIRSACSKLVVAASLASLFATACYIPHPSASARLVRRSKAGGEFALQGHRDYAMIHGEKLMSETCGGPGTFEIVEEGEEVVGVNSSSSSSSVTSRSRRVSYEDTDSASRDVVEWRVKFACIGVEQPAAAPAAPAEDNGAPPADAPPQARNDGQQNPF
ncbi:hypothetical protein [Chondromyces crocatus]|uniref:Secreted protein n=1 Tax=Chondromyces crocatus TaxID=52 RepID=A0A0K1EIQ9_CHOCO|nr:hypothetical protein [Chondromyces crocatus]AKT40751.1 uncharacterized protein CMC5_049070 [Chondromyces crocatus]